MAIDIFTLADKTKEAEAVREAVSQVQFAVQTIRTAVQRLREIKARWEQELPAGKVDSTSLAALQAKAQAVNELLSDLATLRV